MNYQSYSTSGINNKLSIDSEMMKSKKYFHIAITILLIMISITAILNA